MRYCSCCVHKSHKRLDRLLLEGRTFAEIGRLFGVHPEAVSRHFQAHVKAALQKHALIEKETLKRGSRLQDQLNYISDKAQSILEAAERASNFGVALAALKELRESARLAAIAAGELDEGNRTQVNIQL